MNPDKYPFVRWLISSQLVSEKGVVWEALFKNLIAFILVLCFVVLSMRGISIPQEFNILIGIVIGFYFTKKDKI